MANESVVSINLQCLWPRHFGYKVVTITTKINHGINAKLLMQVSSSCPLLCFLYSLSHFLPCFIRNSATVLTIRSTVLYPAIEKDHSGTQSQFSTPLTFCMPPFIINTRATLDSDTEFDERDVTCSRVKMVLRVTQSGQWSSWLKGGG